jgi:hypothetical protein
MAAVPDLNFWLLSFKSAFQNGTDAPKALRSFEVRSSTFEVDDAL